MHTGMHACIHAYIHTYVRTVHGITLHYIDDYISTCLSTVPCITPSFTHDTLHPSSRRKQHWSPQNRPAHRGLQQLHRIARFLHIPSQSWFDWKMDSSKEQFPFKQQLLSSDFSSKWWFLATKQSTCGENGLEDNDFHLDPLGMVQPISFKEFLIFFTRRR